MPIFGQSMSNNQGVDNYPDVILGSIVDGWWFGGGLEGGLFY